MPRYRFNWSNFDPEFLEVIAQGLSISGDPSAGLQAKYGLRPKEDFIQDAWQGLLATWLQTDVDACAELAAAVRKRGLGEGELADDIAFLQTCRNSQGLRQEALQIFLRKGEQSKGSIPRPSDSVQSAQASGSEGSSGTPTSSESPTRFDRESLITFAKEAVASLYGMSSENVFIDSDGDILAPCGSAGVFVSVVDDAEFRVFSIALRNPRECDDLFRLVNEINASLRIGRMFYSSQSIIIEHNLPARWTALPELRLVIDMIGDIADFYDHRLQERLGGELFLRERAQDEISV